MTLKELIERAQRAVDSKLAERSAASVKVVELRSELGDANPSADLAARIESAVAEKRAADEALPTLEARVAELRDEADRDARAAAARPVADTEVRTGGAEVKDPEIYFRGSEQKTGASFFRDSFIASSGLNFPAQERLRKHEARTVDLAAKSGTQTRAVGTAVAGSLVVPQYLPDMFAPLIRAGRPFANLVQHLSLPAQGVTITLPRLTTGTTAAEQATQNVAVSNTDLAVTDLTIPVVTVAGGSTVSRQVLERGDGVDELIYQDLAYAYAARLDYLTLNGSGSSGQPYGLFNTSGVLASSTFSASVTATTFFSKVGGIIGSITGQGAGIVPRAIVMHPRRWAWLTVQVDTQGRPLVVPTAQYNSIGVNANPGSYGGDLDPVSGLTIVGLFQGLPVITDANIPVTKGTDSVQDVVAVVDTTKIYLWEDGDGMPQQLKFEQTLGQNLSVVLEVYSYVAFTAGRYPGASGTVGGADGTGFGLQAPSF